VLVEVDGTQPKDKVFAAITAGINIKALSKDDDTTNPPSGGGKRARALQAVRGAVRMLGIDLLLRKVMKLTGVLVGLSQVLSRRQQQGQTPTQPQLS